MDYNAHGKKSHHKKADVKIEGIQPSFAVWFHYEVQKEVKGQNKEENGEPKRSQKWLIVGDYRDKEPDHQNADDFVIHWVELVLEINDQIRIGYLH